MYTYCKSLQNVAFKINDLNCIHSTNCGDSLPVQLPPPPPHYSVSVSDGIDGGVKYQVLWLAGGCEEAGREGKTNPTNSPLLREVSE